MMLSFVCLICVHVVAQERRHLGFWAARVFLSSFFKTTFLLFCRCHVGLLGIKDDDPSVVFRYLLYIYASYFILRTFFLYVFTCSPVYAKCIWLQCISGLFFSLLTQLFICYLMLHTLYTPLHSLCFSFHSSRSSLCAAFAHCVGYGALVYIKMTYRHCVCVHYMGDSVQQVLRMMYRYCICTRSFMVYILHLACPAAFCILYLNKCSVLQVSALYLLHYVSHLAQFSIHCVSTIALIYFTCNPVYARCIWVQCIARCCFFHSSRSYILHIVCNTVHLCTSR